MMSLSELSLSQPYFGSQWDDGLTQTAESRTADARRAALARRARVYVDLYLAEAKELPQSHRLLSEDTAADIAFGRSDCDFLFRD